MKILVVEDEEKLANIVNYPRLKTVACDKQALVD